MVDSRVKLRYLAAAGLFLLVVALVGGRGCRRTQIESRFDKQILAAAQRYQVDPALVKAVIWRESRFRPGAHGGSGEIGLMQVNKLAAQEWAEASNLKFFTHHELYDPEKNIFAGAWYLGKMLKRYAKTDNPIPYALADYNAGRSNVLRWTQGEAARQSRLFMNQIDFPGTKEYVYTILKRYNYYKTRIKNRA